MKWTDVPREYPDRLERLRKSLESDPYSVLDVASSASNDEVRAAYRRKVRAYHPDRQDDFIRAHAQEVLKIVNSAYEKVCRARGM